MKFKLNNGHHCLIDESDYEWLSKNIWWAAKASRGRLYAIRQVNDNGKIRTVMMHREILQTPKGYETDHINNDGLDNRRCNLRVVTKSQNLLNMNNNLRSDNTSGTRGVSWCNYYHKWRCYITMGGKNRWIGYFRDKQEAINKRKEAERELGL